MNGDSIFSIFTELITINPVLAQLYLFTFTILFLTIVSRMILSVVQNFFFKTVPAYSDYIAGTVSGGGARERRATADKVALTGSDMGLTLLDGTLDHIMPDGKIPLSVATSQQRFLTVTNREDRYGSASRNANLTLYDSLSPAISARYSTPGMSASRKGVPDHLRPPEESLQDFAAAVPRLSNLSSLGSPDLYRDRADSSVSGFAHSPQGSPRIRPLAQMPSPPLTHAAPSDQLVESAHRTADNDDDDEDAQTDTGSRKVDMLLAIHESPQLRKVLLRQGSSRLLSSRNLRSTPSSRRLNMQGSVSALGTAGAAGLLSVPRPTALHTGYSPTGRYRQAGTPASLSPLPVVREPSGRSERHASQAHAGGAIPAWIAGWTSAEDVTMDAFRDVGKGHPRAMRVALGGEASVMQAAPCAGDWVLLVQHLAGMV